MHKILKSKFLVNFLIILIFIANSNSLVISCQGFFEIINCDDPKIIVDTENNLHVTWTEITEANDGQKLKKDYITKNVNSSSWSNIKTVNYADSEFKVDSSGILHQVYFDGIDNIYYRYWDSIEDLWSPKEKVSDFDQPASIDPTILVDDDLNVHVAWRDWSNFSGENRCDILYRWKNGSDGNWQPIEIPSLNSIAYNKLDPCITHDSNQNIIVAWIADAIESNIGYRIKYHDNNSWSKNEILLESSVPYIDDLSIACDFENNLHFCWMQRRFSFNEVYYAKFIKNLNRSSLSRVNYDDRVDNPTMTLDQQANVYIAWESGTASDIDIWYKYMKNSTLYWSNKELVSKESTDHSLRPSIMIGKDNILHFVWSDYTEINVSDSGGSDIFYKSKNITSGVWSNTVILTLSLKVDLRIAFIYFTVIVSSVVVASSIGVIILIILRHRKKIRSI